MAHGIHQVLGFGGPTAHEQRHATLTEGLSLHRSGQLSRARTLLWLRSS